MARKTMFCISCDNHYDMQRLYSREHHASGHKWDHTRKVSQPYVGFGWLCPKCGAMFSDEQEKKCRLKKYGSDNYDDTGKVIKQTVKPVKGLDDLLWRLWFHY